MNSDIDGWTFDGVLFWRGFILMNPPMVLFYKPLSPIVIILDFSSVTLGETMKETSFKISLSLSLSVSPSQCSVEYEHNKL